MIGTVVAILLTKFAIVCCQPEDRRENVFEDGLIAASEVRHTDNKNMHVAFTASCLGMEEHFQTRRWSSAAGNKSERRYKTIKLMFDLTRDKRQSVGQR